MDAGHTPWIDFWDRSPMESSETNRGQNVTGHAATHEHRGIPAIGTSSGLHFRTRIPVDYEIENGPSEH